MFASLRHRTVGSGYHQDGAVHLGSTGNHVFYVVGVTGAVYVSIVTTFGFVLYVGGVNGNTAGFFFRGIVNLVVSFSLTTEFLSQNGGQCCCQCGLTMVNVTNGANVYVRFATLEFFLSHELIPFHIKID